MARSPCASVAIEKVVSRSESRRAAIVVLERSTGGRVGASTYRGVVQPQVQVSVVCSTQHDGDKEDSLDEYGVFIQRSQEMGGIITILGPAVVRASVAVGLVAVV